MKGLQKMGPSSQPLLRTDFKTLAINQFHVSCINQLMQSTMRVDALSKRKLLISVRRNLSCSQSLGGVEISSDIILQMKCRSTARAVPANAHRALMFVVRSAPHLEKLYVA
jgi:hypothetical protein